MHEKGINIRGAFITGDIDLEGCETARSLWLLDCHIAGSLIGRNARLREIFLQNSSLGSINCNFCRCEGSVRLVRGFEAQGPVSFLGADIAGDMSCVGGKFKNANGDALQCDNLKVTSSVFLSDGFEAEGLVRFVGAKIGGQFACKGGKFRNAKGDALRCDNIQVTSSVFLSDGFESEGGVHFLGAEIGGQLSCKGGKFKSTYGDALGFDSGKVTSNVFLSDGFESQGAVRFLSVEIGGNLICCGGKFSSLRVSKEGEDKFAAYALSLYGANVHGVLLLGPAAPPHDKDAKFVGSINLQGAHARQFVDNVRSWPVKSVQLGGEEVPCVIDLDGFTYGQLARGAPTDVKTRKKWLMRQSTSHLGSSFRPQPFEQLIKVLREMGHAHDAQQIGYFKEYCRLRTPWSRSQLGNPVSWIEYLFRWLLVEMALGHGYRLHRMSCISQDFI